MLKAEGEAVDIVVDKRRHSVAPLHLFLQMHLLPGWNVADIINDAALRIDDGWHRDADGRDILVEELVHETIDTVGDLLLRALSGTRPAKHLSHKAVSIDAASTNRGST